MISVPISPLDYSLGLRVHMIREGLTAKQPKRCECGELIECRENGRLTTKTIIGVPKRCANCRRKRQ